MILETTEDLAVAVQLADANGTTTIQLTYNAVVPDVHVLPAEKEPDAKVPVFHKASEAFLAASVAHGVQVAVVVATVLGAVALNITRKN